jgi:hypothetical protein
MKKLLILAIVIFALWNHFSKNADTAIVTEVVLSVPKTSIIPTEVKSHNFSCDGREYCTQMTSRAEAEYFTKNCPNTKMDGDHDGIPCENDSRF